MPLNTPLSTLRQMLRAAVGDSLSIGTQANPTYNQLLADKQQWLAGVFDFPYFKRRWTITINPRANFYNFPTTSDLGETNTTIDFNRPWTAFINWVSRWQEVRYGIDEITEYNDLNSDTNIPVFPQQANDPIQRWQFAGVTQFEVWPVPVTQQFFRFVGQKNLARLTQDTDTAELDDEFLVYSVAVDILSRKKSADAQARLAQAQERIRSFRAVYPVRTKEIIVGGRMKDTKWKRLVPVIGVAGGPPPTVAGVG